MEAIYIPRLLKLPGKIETITIDEPLPALETLTPVRGQMQVKHQGNYLDVSAQAETIITLTCHRCLQQYNHRLALQSSELVWLDESANQPDMGPIERETPLDELVETLDPQGHFEPDTWLYEQLCLAIPPRQLCDRACPGIQPVEQDAVETNTDRRWDALEALKRQLS